MVRLKAIGNISVTLRSNVFQFHYGTIKSGTDLNLRSFCFISIPLWYD